MYSSAKLRSELGLGRSQTIALALMLGVQPHTIFCFLIGSAVLFDMLLPCAFPSNTTVVARQDRTTRLVSKALALSMRARC